MISIPLYFFLILYLIYLVVFGIFFLMNFIHLFHTGGTTKLSFLITIALIALATAALLATWYFLAPVNWSHTLDLGSAPNDLFQKTNFTDLKI